MTSPTCFKATNPTLLDVILTNKPRCFNDAFNIDLGLSDHHSCVGVSSRAFAPLQIKRKITYRSMRKFSEEAFKRDVDCIPFHVCDIFDDTDDIYWAKNKMFMTVVEDHAPMKSKCVSSNQVPYMNSQLRKAMNQRNMWRSKFYKNRRNYKLRCNYTKWRNTVVRLRKQSINNYFSHRCTNSSGGKEFYNTIKPFIGNKSSLNKGSKIILREEDEIISNPSTVADVFNKYYASIAEYDFIPDGLDSLSLQDAIEKHDSHRSILLIRENISHGSSFSFATITVDVIEKYLNKLQLNKAWL